MVESSGHDAVGPQPLGAQFVHFSAGGDGVAAGHHPVIGGRCDDDANPTHEASDETHHLQASSYHGGRSDVHTARPARTVPPEPAWTEPSLGLPSLPSRAAGSGILEMEREAASAAAAGTGEPGGDCSAAGQRVPAPSLNSGARAGKRQSATAPRRAGQSQARLRCGCRREKGHEEGQQTAPRAGDARSALGIKLIPSP